MTNNFPHPERVLVIVAHPDDPEFGAAGTVALWASQGAEVTYVIVTDGSKGSAEKEMTREKLVALREEEQRKAASAAGYLAVLIGGLTLLQYVGSVSIGIDELFMKHDVTVKTSHPGRMAPNTAICFTLVGLALALRSAGWPVIRASLGRVILGSLAFGLSSVAFAGYFTRLETAYGWGNLTRMAVHTSIGFLTKFNHFRSRMANRV